MHKYGWALSFIKFTNFKSNVILKKIKYNILEKKYKFKSALHSINPNLKKSIKIIDLS